MYTKTLVALLIATLAVVALIGYLNNDASSNMLRRHERKARRHAHEKQDKASVGGVMVWYSGAANAPGCVAACSKLGGSACGKYAQSCCAAGACANGWFGVQTCSSRLNGSC